MATPSSLSQSAQAAGALPSEVPIPGGGDNPATFITDMGGQDISGPVSQRMAPTSSADTLALNSDLAHSAFFSSAINNIHSEDDGDWSDRQDGAVDGLVDGTVDNGLPIAEEINVLEAAAIPLAGPSEEQQEPSSTLSESTVVVQSTDVLVTGEPETGEGGRDGISYSVHFSMAKDAVNIGNSMVSFGFHLARLGTGLGFGIARTVLQAPGAAARYLEVDSPLNPVTAALATADMAVGSAQLITSSSLSASEFFAKGALSVTDHALGAVGVEDGELYRTIGRYMADSETVDAGVLVMGIFSKFLSKAKRPAFPVLQRSITAFSYLQHYSMRPPPDHAATSNEVEEASDISRDIRRYHNFVLAAAGIPSLRLQGLLPSDITLASEEDCIEYFTGLKDEDIICKDWSSIVYRPGFYMALDHQTSSIVLVFRGTSNAHDLLTDLTCESTTWYCDGELATIHEGFARTLDKLEPILTPLIEEALHKHPTYRLVCTGYSLGGAVASLLTAYWSKKHPTIRGYAFASPCIAEEAFARSMSPFVKSIIAGNDVFARLCLTACEDLRDILMDLAGDDELLGEVEGLLERYHVLQAQLRKLEDRKRRTSSARGGGLHCTRQDVDTPTASSEPGSCRNEEREGEEEELRDAMNQSQAQLSNIYGHLTARHTRLQDKLFPMGTLLYLTEEGKLWEVDSSYFSQIVLAKDMLTSHMSYTYHRRLQAIL